MNADSAEGEKFSSYHWKLFFFLSVATFFEGYDFIALSQLLPNLRDAFDLSKSEGGLMFAFVNFGTIAAYLMVRAADKYGRKTILMVTIVGYTVCTAGSGLAPDVYTFTAAQFLARIFLIGEWATCMVLAAEEFPAKKRGTAIGIIVAMGSFGSIVCAGTVPLLLNAPWGWRTVYFVAVLPLVLLAIARRGLKESSRFSAEVKDKEQKRPLAAIFSTPYRNRLLLLALIWALTYTCAHTAVSFWKDFAVSERMFTDGQVALSVTIAAVVAMPLVFAVGPMMDAIGRKKGAVIVFLLTCAGIAGCYNFYGQWPLTAALVFGIFGASALSAVLNAFTTELFPTEFRGDAFAWANNLLGRIGYVAAPLAVGVAADEVGWGPAVTATVFLPLIALALILRYLPETRGKDLSETSAV